MQGRVSRFRVFIDTHTHQRAGVGVGMVDYDCSEGSEGTGRSAYSFQGFICSPDPVCSSFI